MADINGNVYKTIANGTQIWMAENLKTTRYRNGDLIGTTTPAILNIISESTPKYQWAFDGNESNVAIYGRLYTGYAVTDSRNVCPTGWHLPADAEWSTLTTHLGGADVAGDKLKETGLGHWLSPNTISTNSSGFTALPGSIRYDYGGFSSIGDYGGWWSATDYSATDAYMRSLYYTFSSVNRGHSNKRNGLSIRCVKDSI